MIVPQEKPQNGEKENTMEVMLAEKREINNKYENMKIKELKCKNKMRKTMIEHVTFKIRNLQG